MRAQGEILARLEANRAAIQAFGVKRLGLFGSAVRGEATETSDLDFLVELEPKSFDAYMGLKEFLENLFACPVDLVLLDSLKPHLRQPIIEQTVYAPGL